MAASDLHEWQTAMWKLDDLARLTLGPGVEHMNAALAAAGAGQTQKALTARWPGWISEIAAESAHIIGTWNPRLERQADALRAAGGQHEVYDEAKTAQD